MAELQARLRHSTAAAAMRYQHASSDRDAEIARRLSELTGLGEGSHSAPCSLMPMARRAISGSRCCRIASTNPSVPRLLIRR